MPDKVIATADETWKNKDGGWRLKCPATENVTCIKVYQTRDPNRSLWNHQQEEDPPFKILPLTEQLITVLVK